MQFTAATSALLLSTLTTSVLSAALPSKFHPRSDDRVLAPIKPSAFNRRSSSNLIARADDQEDLELLPIPITAFESNLGKRAGNASASSLADLSPKDREQFIYGTPGAGNTFFMANMTLTAPDGRQIVSMERFEGMTKSVQCGEKMKLEFTSKENFEAAIKAWNWVNENADNNFIMIANHQSCCPDKQRQPYSVYDVDYDEENFIANLNAKTTTWKEIAQTYEITYGKRQLPSSTRRKLARRGFWSDIGDALNPMNLLNGDHDLGTSLNLNAKVNNPNLWSTNQTNAFGISLGCLDCGLSGVMDLEGHVIVKKGKASEMYFQAKPKGLQASLNVAVTVSGKAKGNGIQFEKSIIPAITLAGFKIPGIFTLGPTVQLDAGLTANIQGEATINYGTVATFSDNAIMKADLLNSDKSTFSGWEPTFKAIGPDVSAQIEADLSIYAKPVLALTFDLIGLPAYQAGFEFTAPELKSTLKAMADTKGNICGNPDANLGLSFVTTVGCDLSFRIGEDKDVNEKTFWEKSLYSKQIPLLDKCLVLEKNAKKQPAATAVNAVAAAGAAAAPAAAASTKAAAAPAASSALPAVYKSIVEANKKLSGLKSAGAKPVSSATLAAVAPAATPKASVPAVKEPKGTATAAIPSKAVKSGSAVAAVPTAAPSKAAPSKAAAVYP